jgi:trans-aconitate 2-methyltransferase
MTKRAWDGKTYDRIGTPQAEWGKVVLDRMQLRGDETIVDAGCGSGRVTELLLERLPQGRVLAIDGSASMIEAARERLGSHANVEFTVMDLLALDL